MVQHLDQLEWFLPKLDRVNRILELREDIRQLDLGITIRNSNRKEGIKQFRTQRAKKYRLINEIEIEEKFETMTVFEKLRYQKENNQTVFDKIKSLKGTNRGIQSRINSRRSKSRYK